MAKIDLKKSISGYTAKADEPAIVTVTNQNFLMIDGFGNPNTASAYKDAVQALFSLSYALKFHIKKSDAAIDYGVMPLEGLWWADDMDDFQLGSKDNWKWTAMIMQPQWVDAYMVQAVCGDVTKKKQLPSLDDVRFEAFDEGLVAQVLHVGPYTDEAPTIQALHMFIEAKGYRLRGKHHEVYLSDPQRSAPEKLRTIIRQPVE